MDELKKNLIALGLTAEQAEKAVKLLEGAYVQKSAHDEAVKEKESLQETVTKYEKQLEDLKTASGDNEELKKQIEQLQKQNADQQKTHKEELAQLKLDNAIDSALTMAGAKNVRAVRALLDISKLKLGEDGKLAGWDEQIAAVQKSDAYLFQGKKETQFRGFQPGASGDGKPGETVDMSKMSYDELAAYMEANPDAE